MNVEKLAAQLTVDEGRRARVYTDSVGKLTVGVGRNISDRDFSVSEIELMLTNDISMVADQLDKSLPWWRDMNDVRQNALANMCFNLGITRLLGFKKMLAALEAKEWLKAATEALTSNWARQVGPRANRIARAFMDGM